MNLSQIKNVFSKIVSFVDADLILTDLNGIIIDSNRISLNGKEVLIPEFDNDKEVFEKSGYYFIFIKQYNSPKFLIGIKDNKSILNIIKLLFDEKKQMMTESDFYRELLLGNIEKSNYKDLKDEFISESKDNYRVIILKASNGNLKNLSIIIDNIFVFDLNLILDSETIVVITSRKDNEIIEMCNFLFTEIYTELSLKTQITIGSKVNKLYVINKSLEDALSIIRLAERFNIKNDIYYYEDFLVPLIVDNMNKDLLLKLNKNNSDKYNKIFQNKDLIFTAESFFKNNLNITETSEKIFVHRNTLIYRINKIKEISGFDLRLFDDALKFYIILLIKNMNEK